VARLIGDPETVQLEWSGGDGDGGGGVGGGGDGGGGGEGGVGRRQFSEKADYTGGGSGSGAGGRRLPQVEDDASPVDGGGGGGVGGGEGGGWAWWRAPNAAADALEASRMDEHLTRRQARLQRMRERLKGMAWGLTLQSSPFSSTCTARLVPRKNQAYINLTPRRCFTFGHHGNQCCKTLLSNYHLFAHSVPVPG
jgi:hypothetical protein